MGVIKELITLVTLITIVNFIIVHGLRVKRADPSLVTNTVQSNESTTITFILNPENVSVTTNASSSISTISTTSSPTTATETTATLNSTSPSSTINSTLTFSSTINSTLTFSSTINSTLTFSSTTVSSTTRLPSTATSASTTAQILPTPTTISTAAPSEPKIKKIIGLLGPHKAVDVVFILSRSQSVGKRNFYEKSRYLTSALLKQYATIHKDYARVAAVSYATNTSVDYDDISGDDGHEPLDKCQLFPSVDQKSFPLDTLKYQIDDDKGSCAVFDAFQRAWKILQKGQARRPGVSQVVVLITDANVQCTSGDNPFAVSSVNMFGVGIGAFYSDVALKAWVPPSQCEVYGIWQNMILTTATSLTEHDQTIFAKTDSNINCTAGVNESCYCNIDLGLVTSCSSEGGCQNPSTPQDCPQCNCMTVSNNAICRCDTYTYGKMCEFFYDTCRFQNICSTNGVCNASLLVSGGNFQCVCNNGFMGDFCESKIPTPGPTPSLLTQTKIITVFQNVTDIPLDVTKTIIVGAVVGGVLLLAVIVTIIICLIFCVRKQKALKKERDGQTLTRDKTLTRDSGIQSTLSRLTSKIRGKGSNKLTMRLSQLWRRDLNDDDGMPSVPPARSSATISKFDLQNLGHEETILQNEFIHDNKSLMKNWKNFLDDLVEKEIITKAVMANLFTKDIMHTDAWKLDWSEIYSLDVNFGIKNEILIQGEMYNLGEAEDGVISGSLADRSAKEQKFISLGRTKKYIVIAIVLASENEDGNECRNEVKSIISHVKLEGY